MGLLTYRPVAVLAGPLRTPVYGFDFDHASYVLESADAISLVASASLADRRWSANAMDPPYDRFTSLVGLDTVFRLFIA